MSKNQETNYYSSSSISDSFNFNVKIKSTQQADENISESITPFQISSEECTHCEGCNPCYCGAKYECDRDDEYEEEEILCHCFEAAAHIVQCVYDQ